MNAKEAAARLEGELAALRSLPWWRLAWRAVGAGRVPAAAEPRVNGAEKPADLPVRV